MRMTFRGNGVRRRSAARKATMKAGSSRKRRPRYVFHSKITSHANAFSVVRDKNLVEEAFAAWDKRSLEEREKWLNRPRLHTAIFEDSARHQGLRAIAERYSSQFDEGTSEEMRQTAQRIKDIAKQFGWTNDQLASFTNLVITFRREPTPGNYVRIRRQFQDLEIQVASFGGMDPLYALAVDFQKQGIDPQLVAGAMDGYEPSIDALSLQILELLDAREMLPKSGPAHIEQRRAAISDAMVGYLIAIMMEAYDWNKGLFRIPAALVFLVRYQLCGMRPDLVVAADAREKRINTAIGIGQWLKSGERPSINKVVAKTGLSRSTVARWLADDDFKQWIEHARRWSAEGIFERGDQARLARLKETADS